MKLWALLAFAGFAAASIEAPGEGTRVIGTLPWSPNTEYTYEYQGRLLTGIPELSSTHFSGIGIKCKLHLVVTRSGRIVLHIREAKYARANQELKSVTGDQNGHNWRYLPLTGYEDVPSESMRMLSMPTPFEVSRESGKVSSIRVSQEEPEWSVNFKKALIALFQTGLGEEGRIRPIDIPVSPAGLPTPSSPSIWYIFEQAPDGECETKYEMTEVSRPVAQMASEEFGELSIPMMGLCSTPKVYEIIKTRNLDNCQKTAMYNFYKPGHLTCMPHEMRGVPMNSPKQSSYNYATGGCGNLWTRSSVTRYGVCGSPDNLLIQSIINEGEVNQHLMDYKTEKVLTGSRQYLKLVGKQSSSVSEESLLSGSGSTVELNSLLFSYSKKTRSGVRMGSGGSETVHDIMQEMKGNGERVNPEELIEPTVMLIKEIVEHDLLNPTMVPESEMSWKALTLAKTFKLFDRSMLQRVYEKVVRSYSGEKKDVAKNILVDTIVMSGVPEAIKFFKYLVERGELRSSQISSIFFALPRTIATPTYYLLEELFELIKSEPITRESYVWNTAVLSFSGLLQKACISPLSKENYPTELHGKFCHKDSPIITERWIPYLRNKLYESGVPVEKKNVIILSLGIMSHEQILPVVIDVVEGNLERRPEHNCCHTTRLLSVMSLVNVGRFQPNKVLPVMSAVFSNMEESTDIRVGAFNGIMALNPDMALLQKIATLTWTEKDTEVLRAVNTAFYSLANQVSMQDFKTDMSVLVRKARILYPLIKKTGGVLPSTGTIFTSDFLTMLKVGYERTISYVSSSEDSILPSNYFDSIKLFMGEEFKFPFVQLGIHQRGVISTLSDTISGLTHTSSEEIKSKLSHEWRQTIEKLRIKVRENRTPEAFFYMRLLEDSTLFSSLSTHSIEHLKNILKNPSLLKHSLSGESSFNWQRVVDLSPSEQVVPSDLGLPIFAEMRRPTVVSVRGHYNADMLRSSESLARFDTTFEVLVDRRITGRVGTMIPFTGEYVSTGIDEKAVGVAPFDIRVNFDLHEGKLSTSLKFPERIRSMANVEVLTHKVRPYTVIQKLTDLTPIFKSTSFKVIKSRMPMHTKEYKVGEYSGINMKLVYNTETPYLGTRYVLQKLSNLHYNPLNMIRFSGVNYLGLTSTGLPSARHHESKLMAEPSSCSTKEIELVLKFGYATKEKGQSIVYHKMEPSQDKLVKVTSRPIGEMRGHIRRQEKIKSMIEKLQVDSEGRALTVTVSTILKGSRPRTFSYTGTVGTGQSGMTSKWDLELMCERTSKKICVRGDIRIPPYSIWKLNDIRSEDPVFRFHNTVGYGTECESKVQIVGLAKTSEKQKQLARETLEAKEFERLRSKGTPMIEMSKLAELVRRQSSVLNIFDYKIKYVNVDNKVTVLSQRMLEALELVLLPYHAQGMHWWPVSSSGVMKSIGGGYGSGVRAHAHADSVDYDSYTADGAIEHIGIRGLDIDYSLDMESSGRGFGAGYGVGSGNGFGSESWEMEVRTTIHPGRGSFDVDITNVTRPEQKYKYRDVPLPYPFTYMYPVSYVTDPISIGMKAVTGKPVYPVCTLEGKHISTFDNHTTKADMDDCFHLLSGDCSKAMSYGVLVSSLGSSSSSTKEVKIFIGRTEITMKPEADHVMVKVNGSPIEVPKVERKTIKNEEGHIVAKIIKSKDNVVVLKSSKVNVLFDGKRVKVEGSNLLKNKLCGLCGDNNNKKIADVPSPRQCLLSKPKLEVASYRVSLPSKRCSPLPGHVRAELERETERCTKFSNKPTGGISSLSMQSESLYGYGSECRRHHHEIVERYSRSELCFSKIPILECGSSCHPVGVREKRVGFTCMPKDDRVTQHIAEKVRRGEVVSELVNMSEAYSVVRPMPVECRPYTTYGMSGSGSGNSLF